MATGNVNRKHATRARGKLPLIGSNDTELSDLLALKQEWSQRILMPRRAKTIRSITSTTSTRINENVLGVGVGEKIVEGIPVGTMSIKFFVRTKYPQSHILRKNKLPKMIAGLPVDVEESGVFRSLATGAAASAPNPQTRLRPALPGASVGFRVPGDQFFTAGTFGALVRDSQGTYILSNNHVLANENQLPLGSPIFQPGLIDDGSPGTDQIAILENFSFLEPGVFNNVDCAIAKVLDVSQVSNSIIGIGAPRGTREAFNDMIVHKFGRSTGYRAGRIISISTDIRLQYHTNAFMFEGQIIIQGLNGRPFADQGDSGALVLERETQLAVGLLIGVGRSSTGNAFAVANHLSDILRLFRVRLV